jgi:hypothetical protein
VSSKCKIISLINNRPSGIADGSSPEHERQFLVVGEKDDQRMYIPRDQAVHVAMVPTNRGETTGDNDLR